MQNKTNRPAIVNKQSFALITAALVSALISGCGTRIDAIQDTATYALFGRPDLTLTAEQIDERRFPLQYVTLGQQPRVALGLAFNDKGLYKWLSQSQEVLVTHHGRIVQTQGLKNDLAWVDNLAADPLVCLTEGRSHCQLNWRTTAQVGNGLGMAETTIQSRFEQQGQQTLNLTHTDPMQVIHWRETITTAAGEQWVNHYWLEKETRRVVKSEQTISPAFPLTVTEEIKPYSGDLNSGGSQ